MDHHRRAGVVAGLVLILLGTWFLVAQFIPGLQIEFSWPLIIVAVGVFLLLFGLLVGAPEMAVPASIVGGIGGLLYWQNVTGQWESWAYAWTLIPGFVGVGTVLSGLLGRKAQQVRRGAWLILISLVMFAFFGSFFGALGFLGIYWPVLLIALGVLGLVNALLRPRR